MRVAMALYAAACSKLGAAAELYRAIRFAAADHAAKVMLNWILILKYRDT
jgi:hypothetical protein